MKSATVGVMSRMHCRLLVLAFAFGLIASGCAPDRHGFAAPGAPLDGSIDRMDGGSIDRDAAMFGGDSGARIDAGPPGCPAPCTDGRVCMGTACVCPAGACCPACGAGTVCAAGSCAPCGGAGQPCCDTGPACTTGHACVDGRCSACGLTGQPCCAGSCTDGSSCAGGTCIDSESCGGDGEDCCSGGVCDMGLTCQEPILFGSATCRPCGDPGEPCCSGSCNGGSSVYCDLTGTCRDCGHWYTRCYSGGSCAEGICRGGYCT